MSHRPEEVELGLQERWLPFLPLHLVQVVPVAWWSCHLLRLVRVLHAAVVVRPDESAIQSCGTRRVPMYEWDGCCSHGSCNLGNPIQWLGRLMLRICLECEYAQCPFGRDS